MFLTLLPYLAVAVNMLVVLGILLTFSQRVRQPRANAGKQEATLQAETARLSAAVTELRGQILELQQSDNSLAPASPVPAAGAATANGVNNTLRNKVLKMHRLGQSPDRIAVALRVPQGEVDLLVKVHKIVMRPYEEVVLAPLSGEKS